nr:reverse transcriptase domain-containing protein [Tanacetum cinerariifolium]
MSSDSHATITYTSMSSYEVIVNGYYGMLMDPLDPYVQLVIEAPPSTDYIPGPEAPPSPDYIPGPKYLEYLPPADDVLPAEEQPLPAAVSPTAESPGYITESDPKMEPEEEDGDNEKSDDDSIEYPTSRGDDDADDDGDDLSEDDADDEDEEESSDSEEEEEEHLALTVLAPALYSSVSASEETEPFEEGKTAATPPPFGYRVAARISKMAPKRTTRSTQVPPVTPALTATTTTVTEAQLQALIDLGVATAMAEAEASRVRNGYDINGSGPRLTQAVRECTYLDFLKCQPLNFKGTEGNSHVKTVTLEVAQALPWKTLKKMMIDKYYPRGEIKKLKIEMCELKTKGTDVIGYSRHFQELVLMCDRTFPEEFDREAIEFATELMDKRIRDAVENKRKFEGADRSFVSTTFSSQIDIAPIALDHQYNVEIADGRIIGLNTIMRDCTLNFLNHLFNIDLLPLELDSFDVIVGMDWLSKYDAVIACGEKLVHIPFGNEILTIRGEGSNERNES